MITHSLPSIEARESGIEWLRRIPIHWRTERAKWLFLRVERDVRMGDEVVTCFRDGVVTLRKNRRLSGFTQSLEGFGYQGIRRGDLVIHTMDAFAGAIGISDSDGKSTSVYSVCLPRNKEVYPYYYALTLREMARSQWILAIAKGIRERSTDFRFSVLSSQVLPVPPWNEQRAIVRFLVHADRSIQRYIRAKQKLIALLEEQKQAIIHQAVTGQIDVRTARPYQSYKNCSISWLRHVPAHWAVRRIGQLARVGNGSTPSRSNLGYWNGRTFPWLNSSCVNELNVVSADQFVTEQAIRECHLPRVPPGSVLVGITGEGKTRGRATILRIEATTNQHVAFIIPESTEVSTGMLQVILTAAYTELRTISNSSGSTKSALTCEDIGRFRIVVPPMTEQDIIVSYVRRRIGDIDRVIEMSKRMIVLLKEYRTVLVRDLVTGKLDVRKA